MTGYLDREGILIRMERALMGVSDLLVDDYSIRLSMYGMNGMDEKWMGSQGLSGWDQTSLDLDALSRSKLRRKLAIKRGALV